MPSGSWRLSHGLVVRDRPPPCSLEIIVLAVPERPKKSCKANEPEQQRQRNEKYQNFHQPSSCVPRCARSAFSITSRDEPDIAAAATSGVASPAIAKGTASRL